MRSTKCLVVVKILYQVSCRDFAEVSAALEVSYRLALRSQVLLKSSADLRRGFRNYKI